MPRFQTICTEGALGAYSLCQIWTFAEVVNDIV